MGHHRGDNGIEMFLGDVSKELGASWKQVGRRLGIQESVLENIKHDYKEEGQAEMGFQMLLQWRQKNGMEHLASKLDDGLRQAERIDIAEIFVPRLKESLNVERGKVGRPPAEIAKQEEALIRYLRKYYKTRSKVPVVPWVGRSGKVVTVELETVYTNLELLIDIDHPYLPLRIPLKLEKLFDKVRLGDLTEEGDEMTTKSDEDGDMDSQSEFQICRVVARGRTGSGKTTLLLKMSDDWANRKRGPLKDAKAVFLIPLRKFDHMSNLGEAIVSHLLPSTLFTPEFVEKFIEENQNEVVVLLDGYDEFKGKGLNQEECGNIVKLLQNEYLPDVRVFVTTRPGRVGDFLTLENDISDEYRHLEITGFSSADIDTYIRKIFVGNRGKVLANRLLRYLEENHLKTELASLPLMCCAFCQLTKLTDGQDFKDMNTISTLFDKLIQCLVRYHPRSAEQTQPTRQNRNESTTQNPNSRTSGACRGITTEESNSLLTELGKVALEGFFRPLDESQTEELIFSRRDFQNCKPSAEDVIRGGCKIGILYRDAEAEYRPTKYEELEINNEDIDNSARTLYFVLKIFQEKLSGKCLAQLSKDNDQEFMRHVKSIQSMQRATDLCNVLMFACGSDIRAARVILEHIAELLLPEADKISDFMKGKLHYTNCGQVQKIIEFCFQLNFESQSEGKLNDVLGRILSGCTRIRLVGISSYVMKSLGYALEYSDGLPIKALELIRLHLDSSSEFREFLNTFSGLEEEVSSSMNKKLRKKKKRGLVALTQEKRIEMLQNGDSKERCPKYLLQRTDDVFVTLLPVWQNISKMQKSEWNFRPVIEGLRHCPLEELILNGVKAEPNDWMTLFSTIGSTSFNSLQKLTLGMTGIEDEHLASLAPAIRSQTNLRYLKLSGNEVGIDFLEALEGDPLTTLETLILDKTEMDTQALELLGKLLSCFPALRKLDIRRNEGSTNLAIKSVLDNVHHCENLECFMISLYQVTGSVFDTLHQKVVSMEKLKELHLVHTPYPEMVLRKVAGMLPMLSRLQDLRISGKPPNKTETGKPPNETETGKPPNETESQSSHGATDGGVSTAIARSFADSIVATTSLTFVSLLYYTMDAAGFLYLLEKCDMATENGLQTLRFSKEYVPKDDHVSLPVREAEKKFLRIWV
ncbi:uncharacterized protein [Diadema antillarum]|uniref:uncharacterized protein n=1 Tax=Diadema antillarum TaxID=105358 RepID=UPI003A8B3F12